ncbi:MAG: Rpn family recombination-promoting nuclease/putative transposase [Thermoguttaceae bacterium]
MSESESDHKPTSEKLGNIYDTFVKSVFDRTVVFADFLRNYADPKFVAQIDLDRIEPAPTHYFGKEGDERIVDLVFRCPLKNRRKSRQKLLAVIIFEHQSTSLREIPQKLCRYISAIWDSEKKRGEPLSAPYFIILRTGKKPHKGPKPRMSDLLPKDEMGEQIGSKLEIHYDVVDLPELDSTKLIGLPQLRLVMGILKKMTERLSLSFGEALMPLREFANEQEQIDWLRDTLPFVSKVFAAHNQRLEQEELNCEVKKVFGERTDEMMLTVFEQAELRGETRGEARGKARERAERVAEVLDLRFEKVPYQLTEQILMMTDLDRLEKLFRLACKCTSLADFEAELG